MKAEAFSPQFANPVRMGLHATPAWPPLPEAMSLSAENDEVPCVGSPATPPSGSRAFAPLIVNGWIAASNTAQSFGQFVPGVGGTVQAMLLICATAGVAKTRNAAAR